jgi:hypothetical protein
MKRFLALMLWLVLGLVTVLPANAQIFRGPNAARDAAKAGKKQQKAFRKAAWKRQIAMQKAAKKQQKDAKRAARTKSGSKPRF